MPKLIKCPCGYLVKADSDDALVQAAQRHAADVHGMQLTRDQALAMAEPA